MTIDKAKAMKSLRAKITKMDNASQEFANIGYHDPIDRIDIELNHKARRKQLEDYVSSLIDIANGAGQLNESVKHLEEPKIALLSEIKIDS